MSELENFLHDHTTTTRRWLLKAGAGASLAALWSHGSNAARPPELEAAITKLEPYLTPQDDFRDVSRGDPLPHELSAEKKHEVGMTRETWKLEVVSDPDHPADVRSPMTIADGTAFNFNDLMELAKTKAVRFPKVMTCLNIGRPLGMGIWEGVPLRDVFWLTQPRKDIRRVFYYGYHNDQPKQMFRSSLPIDRVLEDLRDVPPVILCYKLNGDWLTSQRGGPVRVVVPEAYGFKSIKWVNHITLTNLYHANDTYAGGNNDIDSDLKTFAATLFVPKKVRADQRIPISGYAQVGPAGLSKVQVFVQHEDEPRSKGDKYFAKAPWIDATVLPPPSNSLEGTGGADLYAPNNRTGTSNSGPTPFTRVHWCVLLDGLPVGEYLLRSRTIDENGLAQPMPRPFQKSGHARIEEVPIIVEA